jgi:hypothetical protein
VSRTTRESIADWLMVFGAAGLFGSLFLTWSHQFSAAFLAQWASSGALVGVPRNPTAWQVYSVADVLLAVLAVALGAVALRGSRSGRFVILFALAIALVFTLHALTAAPTNGALLSDPNLGAPNYTANSPSAGIGETIAIIALGLGIVGVALSFTADY